MNRVFTPRDVQSGCVHLPVRAHWAATPSLQMADGPTQEERMNPLYSPGSRALSASESRCQTKQVSGVWASAVKVAHHNCALCYLELGCVRPLFCVPMSLALFSQ